MGREKKGKKSKGSAGFNRKNSQDFFVKNRIKDGVFETESGLQYLIIEEFDGQKPEIEDSVVVEQRISLLDGSFVDDTYKSGIPARFTLKEAIEGYREGLLLMSRGSRYRFFIPSDLAWGKKGAGTKIGPESLLIIDVRLLEILD